MTTLALQYLREISALLRNIVWPKECQENIDAAIVFIDCAIQNILEGKNG